MVYACENARLLEVTIRGGRDEKGREKDEAATTTNATVRRYGQCHL